jgi:hypothetical protein
MLTAVEKREDRPAELEQVSWNATSCSTLMKPKFCFAMGGDMINHRIQHREGGVKSASSVIVPLPLLQNYEHYKWH